jgi:hypothetical protein
MNPMKRDHTGGANRKGTMGSGKSGGKPARSGTMASGGKAGYGRKGTMAQGGGKKKGGY